MKKLFIVFVAFTAFYSFSSVSCQEGKTQDSLNWEQQDVKCQTADGYTFLTSSKASWVIFDKSKFKNSVYNLKGAQNRLNDIIPPAVQMQIGSYKRKELCAPITEQRSQNLLKPNHIEDILALVQNVTKRFGIKLINLEISVKDV